VKKYRKELHRNISLLSAIESGAGSKILKQKTIREAAKMMSVHPFTGRILYNLARAKPDQIIEFGTAFGISTMYLASGNPYAKVITVEGNTQLAKMATAAFKKFGFTNVTVMNRNFSDVVPELHEMINGNTMVFIDGHHTYEATMELYQAFSESRIVVFDDIRWSAGMTAAWKEIKRTAVSCRIIDLWKIGIIKKP
jgi:predicted O-methyltransferase YrrM